MNTPQSAIALCREEIKALNKLKEEREVIFAAGTNTAANLSGMPSASGVGRKVEVSAARIADIDRELDELETTLREDKIKAEAIIGRGDNELHKKILRYYYLEGLTVAEVADILHYTQEYIKFLKGEALSSVF